MNTKLTLSINRAVIDRAKRDLQTKDNSLSSLVEDYLRLLITTKIKRTPNTPLVEELTGLAKPDEGVDEQEIITQYLLEKYK